MKFVVWLKLFEPLFYSDCTVFGPIINFVHTERRTIYDHRQCVFLNNVIIISTECEFGKKNICRQNVINRNSS